MANPQSEDVLNPHSTVQQDSKWCNGVAPGFRPGAGTGLTLVLGAGTSFYSNTRFDYGGGTLTLTDNATNRVFLDTTASNAPAFNTTGYPTTGIPLCTVVTVSGAITSIVDDRTYFGRASIGSYVGEIAIPLTTRGDFQLAHGLGTIPLNAQIQLTTNGLIRFQTTRYDATYLYLNASADNLQGYVGLWI